MNQHIDENRSVLDQFICAQPNIIDSMMKRPNYINYRQLETVKILHSSVFLYK